MGQFSSGTSSSPTLTLRKENTKEPLSKHDSLSPYCLTLLPANLEYGFGTSSNITTVFYIERATVHGAARTWKNRYQRL